MPDARAIFGTDEVPPARRILRAEPLSATLEAGQLREVRWHGVEVLRGIAWLLRDATWGTVPLVVDDLHVDEDDASFRITYVAQAGSDLLLLACIEGSSDGALRFEVISAPAADVTTNRAGFVVLHPDYAAGLPLAIEHPDGRVEATAFPLRISPHQPAFEVSALSYAPVAGITARVAFEGGTWEMEDQRNWSDASFKTYVRPLAWTYPYVLKAGIRERQVVTVTLSGRPVSATPLVGRAKVAVQGHVPPLWLRLDEALPVPFQLPLPSLAYGLIVRLRLKAPDLPHLAAARDLAAREGLALAIEAILPTRDLEAEARTLLSLLDQLSVEALLLTAERDAQSRPTGVPIGEAPLSAALLILRAGFGGRIGTGTPAFFAELNRNPPPSADFVFFGVSAIVHEASDVAVMQAADVLPAVLESATALLPGVGLWPGPLAIAPALNPAGGALVNTDGTTRTPMAACDPRHGALFGAAYLVRVLAHCIFRTEALAPFFVNGPLGMAGLGSAHPFAHVHAIVAKARGAPLLDIDLPVPSLAWDDGERIVILANPTGDVISLPNLGARETSILDVEGWKPALSGILPPYSTFMLRGTRC